MLLVVSTLLTFGPRTMAVATPLAHSPAAYSFGSPVGHSAWVPRIPCDTPACPPAPFDPMTYHGGPIVTKPKVYFVVFSDSQTSISPSTGFVQNLFSPTAPNGAGAVNAIVNSSYLDSVAAEYDIPSKGYFIQHGSYAGVISLYNPTLADSATINDKYYGSDCHVNCGQLTDALSQALTSGQLPDPGINTIYVVELRGNQTLFDHHQGNSATGNYCGFHDVVGWQDGSTGSTQPWIFQPYILMPNDTSRADCAGSNAFDAHTSILSHEIYETITDPLISGWFNNRESDGEIGDLCAWGTGPTVAEPGYNYVVQAELSNAGQDCVTQKTPANLTASYANPSASTSTINVHLDDGMTPVPNASLLLVNASGIVDSTTTDTNGDAQFLNAPTSGVSVYYAGDAKAAGWLNVPSTPPITSPPAPSLSTTPNEVDVSWSTFSPDNGESVLDYIVKIEGGGQTSYCSTLTTSCSFKSLSNGTPYSVEIKAVTPGGETSYSAPASATPATWPSAPQNFTLTLSGTSVHASWSPPFSDGGAPITGYVLSYWHWLNGNWANSTIDVAAGVTSTDVTGLTYGESYSFDIWAVNATGRGNYSIGSATPDPPPSPPTNLSISPSVGSLTASWAPAISADENNFPISSYLVTVSDGVNSATCTTTNLSCSVTGLSANVSYSVSVIAVAGYQGGVGFMDSSADVVSNQFTLGAPLAPTVGSVSPLNRTAVVTWSSVHSATSYLASAVGAGHSFTCTSTATQCAIVGLTNGVAYSISVVASNSYGSSPASTVQVVTPAANFTATISAPSTAVVGSTVTVTVRVNAGLPVSTLPTAGSVIRLTGPHLSLSASLSASGVATFAVVVGAGTNALTASLAGGSLTVANSPVAISGRYLFAGYGASTPSVGSSTVSFTLGTSSGTLSGASALALGKSQVIGLSETIGATTTHQPCSFAGTLFACTLVQSTGIQTLAVQQLIDGVWTNLLGPSSIVPFGSTLTAGHVLGVGQSLTSANGQFTATLLANGSLAVSGPKGAVWQTGPPSAARQLVFTAAGTLYLVAPSTGHVTWQAPAKGTRLVLLDNGILALYSGVTLVWSSH